MGAVLQSTRLLEDRSPRIISRPREASRPARRLLFVTGTPTSVRGGSGTFVGISVLRRALEEAGHRVDLVAPTGNGSSTISRFFFNLGARGAARGRNYDGIVGFDLDGLFVSSPGTPRIAAIKGVIADEQRFERGMTRLSLGMASRLEKIHVERSDLVLATSEYASTRIQAAYGVPRERIRIVPEPISRIRWEAALAASRRVEREGPGILCVAHLYPRKAISNLIRALLLMRTPARLRVVGTGPQSEALQALARALGLSERVTFLGHVSFERLAEEYRSADVFCLPSVQEGFGIVFLEAMASGLPIVACEAAAMPEVVADDECGVLVPPLDVPALAFALDRLASSEEERRRLGGAGRRRAALYDAPIVAEQFLEAIGL
jgi:glycosyltransferase involved in cell wall biosynthesis